MVFYVFGFREMGWTEIEQSFFFNFSTLDNFSMFRRTLATIHFDIKYSLGKPHTCIQGDSPPISLRVRLWSPPRPEAFFEKILGFSENQFPPQHEPVCTYGKPRSLKSTAFKKNSNGGSGPKGLQRSTLKNHQICQKFGKIWRKTLFNLS